jgi:hypothetical protein
VSEQPAAAPRRAGGSDGNVLTHKLGPLPTWGWISIAGGGLIAWRLYSNSKSSAASASASATSPTTAADQVPYFINQVFTSRSAPAAPSSASSSAGATTSSTSSAPVPTNPAPVGSATQPKPTTTLGAWSYPAPTGLQVYDQAKTGVRLSWNAVTGPSGQHPNSYTVATYNAKGQLVDQFDTTAGNTNTAEYGKGGKGLPKGTYHSNVWGNGGPVAPPHATVQYTLTG